MQMMDEATELCARAAAENDMGKLLAMSIEASALLGRIAAARATHAALDPWAPGEYRRWLPWIEREQELPYGPVPAAAHLVREPVSALVPTLY